MPALLRRTTLALAAAALLTPLTLAARQDQPQPAAQAAAPAPSNPYAKVIDDAATGISRAELSARTLKPVSGKGPAVILVSAVHIADAVFYKSLQELLDKQDVVLFEGVKPPGAGTLDLAKMSDADKAKLTSKRIDLLGKLLRKHYESTGSYPETLADLKKSEKRFASLLDGLLVDAWGRPITYKVEHAPAPAADAPKAAAPRDTVILTSFGADGAANGEGPAMDIMAIFNTAAPAKPQPLNLQQQLADALGLEFQLNAIDSSKPNWRNSDMAADEVEARIAAAGGDADALFSMLDGSSMMSKLAGMVLMFVKASPQMAATTKLMLLEAMTNADKIGEDAAPGAKGPMAQMNAMMKVIVKDRNVVVLDDLKKIIADEPGIKSVAIFYGAGHMKDLEQHLVTDLGYKFDSEQWFPAMSVNPAAAGLKPKDVQQMRAMIKRQLETQMKGK